MEYVAKYMKKYRPAETWQGPINVRKKTDHLTEALVTGRGSSFTILLRDYVNGIFICILEINVGCPLSNWDDIFWNMERLSQLMNPVDAATVVYGIRALAGNRG